MNAGPLLRELQAAGVALSATGDRLHVEAPAGTVTPELRQRIAENKACLLAELHQSTTAARDTRTALLALADRLGLDPARVHRIADADLVLWSAIPEVSLRAYLLALDDTATRQAGRIPAGDTAAIHCKGCGPVWVHPGIAAVLPVVGGWPRALGCPWCFVRRAGAYIPRASVECADCGQFNRDTVNPAAGMGACAAVTLRNG